MFILGIDPGVSGSLALLDEITLDLVDHLHMPTIKIGSKNRVNAAAIAHWLALHEEGGIVHVFLEQVNAMPSGGVKMGAASAFSFGHSAGLIEGVITGSHIPLTLVTPQKWKKHAGLIGTDKDAARSRCVQLYPYIQDLNLKGKGQALADAILIARFGATTLTSKGNQHHDETQHLSRGH
jgi:crossover junction endodeoxyribonuclease RuvC